MDRGITRFRFDFHKVGQGLFYTGKLDEYDFVYDCGSVNPEYLNEAIRAYKNTITERSVDMLILSHFHADHVNGVQSLLEDIAVETVAIPYLTPVERFFLALREDNPLDDWYYDFLGDPISFFFGKKVKRIIVVGEGKRDRENLSSDKMPPHSSKNNKNVGQGMRMDIGKMQDDEGLKDIIRKNDPDWRKFIDDGLLIKDHHRYITVLGVWIFRFFSCRINEEELNLFTSCLRENNIDPADSYSLRDAIRDRDMRGRIRECYIENFGINLNKTSLVVYHGPIGDNNSIFHIDCEEGLRFGGCKHLCPPRGPERCQFSTINRMGQLLTGDIELNRQHTYEKLMHHYSHYLSSLSMIQIPHHGSLRSWRRDILYELKDCDQWIASSGNLHGRFPHITLVLDILSHGHCFCWCNQRNGFSVIGDSFPVIGGTTVHKIS